MSTHCLVVGLGVTGVAVARRLVADGRVTVVDDNPGSARFAERAATLEALGVTVVGAPTPERLGELVAAADLVVPSPGVPEAHPVYALAGQAGVPLRSEIELAGVAAAERGVRMVAVTGTNGKTTVTTLLAEMLTAGGQRAAAAGNIGRPLLDAVHDEGVDVVVAEVSSFQLRFTEAFRPRVAVLLNVAEDHLDWHPSFKDYLSAKARIFANQAGDDLLVFNADDEAVAGASETAPARSVAFTLRPGLPGAWRVEGGVLVRPDGTAILAVDRLARSGPHDVANALAAAAAAADLGTGAEALAQVLGSFAGLPHRVTPVGQSGGVTFVDDSKATNPHAALAALAGFDSVVLLAGGRNKGLDLGVLRREAGRIRAVVAIGEAAPEVEVCFAGLRPVHRAGSMAEAVRLGAELAEPGDTVLLSPACASFDWYSGYAARGDDFARQVAGLLESRP
ncbi:MAG TPA: UDP-N-acetylmuramoyl-L-alanine--D-glutamate ligase [Acidimicrobiia bacterium]|nr:UDP-N-acetylmuramoyl-L-alanine--D-glutamate ligase [Acidimicrobiia bacterium]